MADNSAQNATDTIATDELSTLNSVDVSAASPRIKSQRVKVQYGVDGDATDVSATNPLPARIRDADSNILDGRTRVATVTPTISAAAIYATGDAVGGLLTFASVVAAATSAATLDSVTIIDKDQELATLVLVLFDQTFTPTADNAAFDPSDADLANCLGSVRVSDYESFNDNAIATRTNIGLGIKLTGTSLFGQLVVRGTPTYTATSDLIVKVAVRGN